MRKAIVYIDGRNFHHGLHGLGVDGKHFNYRKFAEYLTNGKDLVCIKYFGARFPQNIDLNKHNHDDAFLKCLENVQLISVFEGRFLINKVDGRKIPREKGVDVRLATELIFDAFYQSFDDAYVLSSDTDLIPAIQEVKKKFTQIKIFNFAFQKLAIFMQTCDGCNMIYPHVAKQFEDTTILKPTQQTMAALQSKFPAKVKQSKSTNKANKKKTKKEII